MNALPYVRRVEADGLKGGAVAYDLDRLTVAVGPNGSGKTKIENVLSFGLGRPVAGEDAAGRNIQTLLDGPRMAVRLFVVMPDGAEHVREVVREVSDKGAFGAPRTFLDGQEDPGGTRFAALLGRTDAPGGADWIALSPAALTATLALIGADDASAGVLLEDLVADFQAHDGGRLQDALRDLPTVADRPKCLEALAGLAKKELNEARKAKRETTGSTDRSRAEVTTQVDPGEVDRRRAAAQQAATARDDAARRLAEARTRLDEARHRQREHEERAAEIRARVTAADRRIQAATARGDAAPVVGPSDEDLRRLELAREKASREAADAVAKVREYEAAVTEGERTLAAAREETRAAEQDLRLATTTLQGAEQRTARLSQAPCSVSTCWIDGGEIPEGDTPTTHDLPGRCPLIADAVAARDQLPDLRAAKGRAEERVTRAKAAQQKTAERLDEARLALEEPRQQAEALVNAHKRADAALLDGQARARQAAEANTSRAGAAEALAAARREKAHAETDLDAHLTSVDEIGASIDEAEEAIEPIRATFEQAKAAAEQAQAAHATASEDAVRAERLQKDRAAEKAAKDREAAAKRLVDVVEDAQRRICALGEARVAEHAARYIPAPWALDFRDGRVGLLDTTTDKPWSGPGLSGAQRTILAMALDAALDAIHARKYRLVTLELDQVDHAARDRVLGELRAAVERGDVSQALAMLWRPDDVERPYLDGWRRIEIASNRAEAQRHHVERVMGHVRGDVGGRSIADPAVEVVPLDDSGFIAVDVTSDPFGDMFAGEGLADPVPAGPTDQTAAPTDPAAPAATDAPPDDPFDPFAGEAPEAPAPDPQAEIRGIVQGLPGPALRGLLQQLGSTRCPKAVTDRAALAERLAVEKGLTAADLVRLIRDMVFGQEAAPAAEGGAEP